MKLKSCVACGSKKGLHHHHLVPKVQGGSDSEKNLITLCPKCHAKIHNVTSLGGVRSNHGELVKKGFGAKRNKKGALGGIPYGMDRLPNGDLVPNGMEQKVLKMMVKKKEQGWTHYKIASWLNAEKVPTKKGGPWTRTNTSKLLNRRKNQ